MKKIIYDFGSNNGDNIPYYLKKSDVVVAVEANPILCQEIRNRFKREITNKKLFLESCVLTTSANYEEVYFYIHKNCHTLSQFPQPKDPENFEKILLPSKSVLQIISEYGAPYYIKIDIENYDDAILRTLFENDIRPPFISAESHSIKTFALLAGIGNYDAFKLVQGWTVPIKFKNHKIAIENDFEIYSFPPHSGGPFGDDIPGVWMTANSFFQFLAYEKLGWKDVHASNICVADQGFIVDPKPYVIEAIKIRLRPYIPNFLIMFRNAIRKLTNIFK
jgi:FkbM family methyltransferase